MYANAVINVHEDFDIVDFAETFFDTGHQCLIVKEKGKTLHWHVHGTWQGDRQAYKEYPHKGRFKRASGKWSRPVRVAFDKDEQGFQYCCKADPPNVVRKWHITEEQIDEWHRKSNEHNEEARATIKRALDEVHHDANPEMYYRKLKRRAYTFQADQGKLIHPAHLKAHIVTHMFSTEHEPYINYVLDTH